MVYEYYSSVGGTGIAFYRIENMDYPAADASCLDGESSRGGGSVCHIALDIFL